jgi:protein SCO1/2
MKAALLALLLAAQASATLPPEDFEKRVGFDQHLDKSLPLEETFTDTTGRPVRLGNIFGGKPVILVLAYFRCPNLCGIVLNGLLHSVQELKASAGTDYDVIAVSIDPSEPTSRAADKKASYVLRYGRPGTSGGWHFLTGGPAAIERLTNAVGYRYFYDEASGQFAHPSGIVVVTPQGRISQYLLGIEYPPQDLSRALQKASRGERGFLVRNLLLLCFHYNPETGKYSLAITRVLQAAGALTVVALISGILLLHHRYPRRP